MYMPRENDLILCADGGYAHAVRAGIVPHWIIGDCDSIEEARLPREKLLRVPKEKDDTDTMLCIRHALKEGCTDALLLGGIGGRLDHTLANIQSLAFAHQHKLRASMKDANNEVFFLESETRLIKKEENTALSLFSFSNLCEGVSVSGVRYPLENAVLTQNFPLGVSNAFMEQEARIRVEKGLLLVVLSKTLPSVH
jgi:thiamine pyrophosphokinase